FNKDKIEPNIIKEVDTLDELILSVKLNEGIGLTSREVVNEEEVAILDIINSHHHANYVIGYARDINNQFIFDFVALAKRYFNKTL
ncbi:LysR family transcriptional regulator, partial [[Ruminococcus] gnavus]|nr:LysR family transcriptional regulator [Mediterraneibacter gnavus]